MNLICGLFAVFAVYLRLILLIFTQKSKRLSKEKKSGSPSFTGVFAERIGFEPTIPFRGIHAFQACLYFSYSADLQPITSSHFLTCGLFAVFSCLTLHLTARLNRWSGYYECSCPLPYTLLYILYTHIVNKSKQTELSVCFVPVFQILFISLHCYYKHNNAKIQNFVITGKNDVLRCTKSNKLN